MYDLCIIGGGASGLFASVLSAKCGLDTCVTEANSRVGKKLLATGNGKCNLSNTEINTSHYNTDKIHKIITEFGFEEAKDAFEKLGLYTKIKSGRMYPYSEQAGSVLNILRFNLDKYGVFLLTESLAVDIMDKGDYFEIVTNKDKIKSKRVCLASGSNATMGRNSIALFEKFGHKVNNFKPSLCPLSVRNNSIKGMSGTRAEVIATLIINGKNIYSEQGEILFKPDALSGIVSYGLSARLARLGIDKAKVSLDFLPNISDIEFNRIRENNDLINFGLLPKTINANVMERGVESIKNYIIDVERNKDITQAQVMSGGLSLEDFNLNSMESKLKKGLYAIGEALDVDGDCGGYNLHWAWASAAAMVRKLNGDKDAI